MPRSAKRSIRNAGTKDVKVSVFRLLNTDSKKYVIINVSIMQNMLSINISFMLTPS